MSQIDQGDLVQVIRWPCCGGALGAIFLVEIVRMADGCQCNYCGRFHFDVGRLAIAWGPSKAAPVKWLKRYPPLAELERTETNQEITTHG